MEAWPSGQAEGHPGVSNGSRVFVCLFVFPLAHRVRVQVLLLAQPVQEGGLLLQERLPRREEHGSADVQPDPLPVAPRRGAVVVRRRPGPAGLGRGAGAGGARALSSRLAVFVVVVIVVVAVEPRAAALRFRHVRRFPLLVRGRCHQYRTAEPTGRRDERVRSAADEERVFPPSTHQQAPPSTPTGFQSKSLRLSK